MKLYQDLTYRGRLRRMHQLARLALQRYGWGGILGIMGRTLQLYTKSLSYRDFVKMVRQGGIVPDHLNEYFGYGLFVGRKE